MSLVCTDFDKQYKKLQEFRNHYLKMIRLVLNNSDKMTFEQILTYHELEGKINQLNKTIQEFSSDLQGLKKKTQMDESDHKMIKTFKDLLPFMISYYNQIPDESSEN
jgi:hypothetical protein